MPLFKNVASQKVPVFAWDSAGGVPKTGDAANITAKISKDGAAGVATNDVNPTELSATDFPGIYLFDVTQAETNCNLFILDGKSVTANVSIEPVSIYTLEAIASLDDLFNDPRFDERSAILISTTIASYASQTSFTLTAGSPNDDAYNDRLIVITDQVDNTQKAIGVISDYTAATKTITLAANPLTGYVFAAVDKVQILATPKTLPDALFAAFYNLLEGALGFTVDSATFAPTTTQFECTLAGAGDDIYKNQYIRFETGPNAGLAFRITTSEGTTANPNNKTKLTVTTMPAAPASANQASVYGSAA